MAASPGAMNSALSLVESSSWVETGFPRPPQQIKIWIPPNVSNVGVKSWSFL